ncbi:MAG TPA: SDR family NAD(P)-dependent oxidoreductase, partial [Saprospiraceae bacterium]|nr:SDR family NAD(P)-dependent oxidoreductase [Saprospiraceae bacterium]
MDKIKLPGIRQFDLTGQAAIVTGGSKGLGLAMAAGLASAGANVLIVSRTAQEAREAAEGLQAEYGIRAEWFAADVTRQ